MTNFSNHDDDPPLAVVKSRRRRPSGAMSSSSASVASHGSTRSVTEMAPSLPRTPQMVNRLEDLELDVPLKQPELDDTTSPMKTETETSNNNNKRVGKLPPSVLPTTLKAATALSRQRLPPSTSLTRNLYYSSSIPSMGSELFHIHEDLEGDDEEEDWSNYDFSACSLTQRQPKVRKQRKQKQHRKMQRFLERETNQYQSPNRLPNTTLKSSSRSANEKGAMKKEEDLKKKKKTNTSQEEEESKIPGDSPVNHHHTQDIVPPTTTQSITTDDDEESKFHVHNLDYSNAIGRHATHFGSNMAKEEEEAEGGNISVAFTMDDDSVYVCSFASASIPPERSPQQDQQDVKEQVVCPSIHDEVDVDDYDNDQNLDDNGSGTTVDGVAYKNDNDDDDSDSDEDDDEDGADEDDYSLFQDMVSVLTTPEDVTSSVSPPISDDATAATDVVELAHQLLREHHRWETQVIHKTHGSSTLIAAPKKRAPFVMVCSATPHEFHGSTRSQIAIQVDSPIARPTTSSKHKNAAGGDALDNKKAASRHDRKQIPGDSQEGGTDSETPTHTSAPPNPNDNNNNNGGGENGQHHAAMNDKTKTLPKQGSNRRQSSWKPPAQLPDTPASPTSRPEMTKMDSLRQGLSQLHIVSSARGIQRQSSEKQQQQQEQFPSTTPKKKLSWLKLLLPKALRRKVKSVSVTIFGNYHGHSHNNHNNNNSKKTTRTKHAGKENQNRRNANLSRRATLKTERYESAFWNDPTEFAVAERSATSETHPEEMPTPFVPPPSLLPTGQSTKEIRIGPKEINARPFMDKQVSAYSTEIEC